MEDYSNLSGANVMLNTLKLLNMWNQDESLFIYVRDSRWSSETGKWESVPTHVTTGLQCSDTFFWGSADMELVTEETFPILESVVADLAPFRRAAVHGTDQAIAWQNAVGDLFAARVRKMRPQGAVYLRRYPNMPTLWEMFDACGPARETGFGNPTAQPTA